MLRPELFHASADAIQGHMDTLETELKGFETGDSVVHSNLMSSTVTADTALSSVGQARALIEELIRESDATPQNQTGGLSLLAINSVAVLEAEVDALDEKVTAMGAVSSIQSTWGKAKGIITTAIKAISHHLWQIVMAALTLQEWSIEGSLGSKLLGLGSVKIGLKFGK